MRTRKLNTCGARRRRGFTIVELIVAMMVLSVGILGLCTTATVVSRLIGGASRQTIAATIAGARFEQMRSLQCTAIASGSAATRGMQETWGATPSGTRLYLVADTVSWKAAGGRNPTPVVLSSFVRC